MTHPDQEPRPSAPDSEVDLEEASLPLELDQRQMTLALDDHIGCTRVEADSPWHVY